MKTGDIWLAQLDPTVGSEIQKTRPRLGALRPLTLAATLQTLQAMFAP